MARSSAKSLAPPLETGFALPDARSSTGVNPLRSSGAASSQANSSQQVNGGDGAAPVAFFSGDRTSVHEAQESYNARFDEHDENPMMFATLMVARPRTCAAFWCLFYFATTLFLTVILAAAGLDPINTDRVGEVNLNLPYDRHTLVSQAFLRAQELANFAERSYTCRQSDSQGYLTVIAEVQLLPMCFFPTPHPLHSSHIHRSIIFDHPLRKQTTNSDGNLLTTSGLRYLQEVENKILSHPGFAEHCFLNTDECTAAEAARAGTFTTSPGCCVTPLLGAAANVTDASGCYLPRSLTYFFRKYGDPAFDDPAGTLARIEAASASDWANVEASLHKDFSLTVENDNGGGGGGGGAKAKSRFVSSTIQFARPLQAPSDDGGAGPSEDKEQEALEEWLGNAYESYLAKQYTRSGNYRLLYYYTGYSPVGDQVLADLSLAVIGIFLVFFYMWFIFRSVIIACAASTLLFSTSDCHVVQLRSLPSHANDARVRRQTVYEIFCAFFGGNLIYRYLWPTSEGFGYVSFFTLFQALSVFVIIGIGADDCFVFNDIWRDGAGKFKTDSQRLSHTFVHAGKAMLVTSLTTILSFLSNLQSELPLIAAFGVYAALIVFVNYLMVITFFPSVIIAYHSIWPRLEQQQQQQQQQQQPQQQASVVPGNNSSTAATIGEASVMSNVTHSLHALDDVPFDDDSKKPRSAYSFFYSAATAAFRSPSTSNSTITTTTSGVAGGGGGLTAFMSDSYAPWLYRNRRAVLVAFAALVLTFFVLACLVVPVPFLTYTLFPSGTNFHDVLEALQTQFSPKKDPLYAHIVFGLDTKEPLKYDSDFKTYNFEAGGEGDGTPQFDELFDVTTPQAQSQVRPFFTRRHIGNKAACHSLTHASQKLAKRTPKPPMIDLNKRINARLKRC